MNDQMCKRTKVSLVSCTKHPVETVYVAWLASRTEEPVPTVEELAAKRDELDEVIFNECLQYDIPILEFIYFTFLVENCPVSLREQMVRHRIGHKFNNTVVIDHLPNLTDSSFWVQSSSWRELDAGKGWASRGEYYEPENIHNGQKMIDTRFGLITLREYYHRIMELLNQDYMELVKHVPRVDARNILPLGIHHRLTWTLNFQSLKHIFKRRTCWMTQLSMWGPVIEGMAQALRSVDPMLSAITNPPCFKNGKFVDCPFKRDAIERVKGNEPEPPCPLFVHHHKPDDPNEWRCKGAQSHIAQKEDERLRPKFERIWGRNVDTGESLQPT